MMNTVKLPRTIDIKDSGRPADVVPALSASLHLKVAPLSTASITLQSGRTLDVRTYVEMFTENGSAGVFRVRAPKMGLGSQLSTVELEHAVAEVGDYLVTGTIEKEMTLGEAMTTLFGYYKGEMWKLGTVDKNSTKVVLSADYDNILDAVTEMLKQVPSLMIAFDFSEWPYGFLIKKKPTSISAEGRLSRNIESATVTFDDSELCTRVYLKNLGDGASKNTYGSLDADTIGQFGVVARQISGANSTKAIASTTATTYLNSHKNPRVSVDINLVDLSKITGVSLDKIELSKKFGLYVPEYALFVEETVTELSYSDVYGFPKNVTAHLAEDDDAVVVSILSSGKTAKKATKKAENADENADKAHTKVDDLKDRVDIILTDAGKKSKIIGWRVVDAININKDDEGAVHQIQFAKLNITYTHINGLYNDHTFKAKKVETDDVDVKKEETGKLSTIRDSIYDLQMSGSHLQARKYKNSGWTNVVNFKDIISLSGVWSGAGKLSVTAKINNTTLSDSYVRTLVNGSITWSYSTFQGTIPVNAKDDDNNTESTGFVIGVDGTPIWDNAANRTAWPSAIQEPGTSEYLSFSVSAPMRHENDQHVLVRETYTETYELTSGTPASSGFVSVKRGGALIARKQVGNWYTAGWDNAADMSALAPAIVSPETGAEYLSFDMSFPLHHQNEQGTWVREKWTDTLEMGGSTPGWSGYITVRRGNALIARKQVGNWYSAGWENAASQSVLAPAIESPSEGSEYLSFDMYFPLYHENDQHVWTHEQVKDTLTMGSGSPGFNGYITVQRGAALIARKQVGNWYAAGWDNAAAMSVAAEAKTSSTATDAFEYKYPVKETINGVLTRHQVTDSLEVAYTGSWATVKRGSALIARKAIPHTITDFDTTAPDGASKIIGNNTYTNNSDGYYISGSGRDATLYIITSGTWKCDNQSKIGNVNSYLSSAPRAIYKKGWDNARAAETKITMTRGAYDQQSRTYTCTCIVNDQVATDSTFYLYHR